ncbi:MAG: hydroxymethylbilane synthase [Alphaproteobacteria bacterium]
MAKENNSRNIVIGSRASRLALAQAHLVKTALEAGHSHDNIVIKTMTTSGDKFLQDNLSMVGGKALFTKELDEALLQGEVDLVVHSLKDVATELTTGLDMVAILPRDMPFDCLVGRDNITFFQMKAGSVIGTASLRRQAIIKKLRPDIMVKLLRGNVNSRLEKLDSGEIDAVVLATAGLQRINLQHRIGEIFSAEDFPPAPAQGALVVMALAGDESLKKRCTHIHHAPTAQAVMWERQFLSLLDGSCKTPIGCLVAIDGDDLVATGFIADGDLSRPRQKTITGKLGDGDNIMTDLAMALK